MLGLSRCDSDIASFEKRDVELRGKRSDLAAAKQSLEARVLSCEAAMETCKSDLKSDRNALQSMNAADNGDELTKRLQIFGDKHVSVYHEIRRAKWQEMPIGPLGVHLKMKVSGTSWLAS